MNTPKPYTQIVAYAETADGGLGVANHGIVFVPGRGFLEPITNRSFEDVGMKIGAWHYAPVPLWPGAKVFHRKRGSNYTIKAILSNSAIFEHDDGEKISLKVGIVTKHGVMVQRSTTPHSPEWALYSSDESGLSFVRPLSEFTEDRFKIIHNGA